MHIGADVLQSSGWVQFNSDPSAIVGSQAQWSANPAGCTVATCGTYPQGFQTPGAVFLMFRGNLPGGPGGGVVPLFGDTHPEGFKNMGAFIQDDWRVGTRLTLNLGLRYDVSLNGFNQQKAADGRIYQALKAIGSPLGALPKTPVNNYQPRLGFAWDMTGDGKNVLRGGGGIFRDGFLLANTWFAYTYMNPTLDGLFGVLVNLQRIGIPVPTPLSNYVYGVSPLPPGPPPSPTELPRGLSLNGYYLDPDATDPYTAQTHLGYTRLITNSLAVTVNYSHVEGRNEFRVHEANPVEGPWDPNAASYNTCGAPPGYRRYQCAFAKTFGDPFLLSQIPVTTTKNRSRFDELVFHIEQRGRIATFQGNYTLSRAMTYGGITAGVATAGASPLSPQNPDQLLADNEYGPSITDERHRIVLSGVFNLPVGIQVSPILQAASARPYNLLNPFDPTGNNLPYRLITNPQTGETVHVNSERGDPTFNLDLRVTKSFVLNGTMNRNVSVFAEFYNLTNRANFGNLFGGASGSTNFKQPIGYLNGYPSSRQMQLGARLTF
jgi:hypothetical protein